MPFFCMISGSTERSSEASRLKSPFLYSSRESDTASDINPGPRPTPRPFLLTETEPCRASSSWPRDGCSHRNAGPLVPGLRTPRALALPPSTEAVAVAASWANLRMHPAVLLLRGCFKHEHGSGDASLPYNACSSGRCRCRIGMAAHAGIGRPAVGLHVCCEAKQARRLLFFLPSAAGSGRVMWAQYWIWGWEFVGKWGLEFDMR